MRKYAAVTALALAVVALMGLPAMAGEVGTTSYTASAPNPCAVACPYWTDATDGDEAACLPSPLSVPLSWHDRPVTVPASLGGKTVKAVVFRISPAIDYDSFVCRSGSSPDPLGNYFIAQGANSATDVCGFLGIGCPEEVEVAVCASGGDRLGCVNPGERIILRAYNWSDGPTSPAEYGFLV